MDCQNDRQGTGRQKIKRGYLKTGEAAHYLGISRRYLCQLAKEGAIRHSKIGTRTQLFAIKDLDSFVEQYAVGGCR